MKRLKITSLLLAFMMMVALAACNGATAPATAENYVEKLEEVMAGIETANEASFNVDFADADAVGTYVKDATAAYKALADLKAPEEHAAAQELMTEGANTMIEYLGALPEYCLMDDTTEEYQDLRTELLNKYSMALGLITEGYTMVVPAGDAITDPDATEPEEETDPEDITDPEENTPEDTDDAQEPVGEEEATQPETSEGEAAGTSIGETDGGAEGE